MYDIEEKIIEKRKMIEQTLVRQLVKRNSKYKIKSIPKNIEGRYLSYSLYEASQRTTLPIHRFVRYKYSHLSKAIHNIKDARLCFEEEMKKILPIDQGTPIHLLFLKWEDPKTLIKYCNQMKCNIPKKEQVNTLLKLVRKWRLVSQKLHYKYTQQEKRKLKKKEQIDQKYDIHHYEDFLDDYDYDDYDDDF